MGGSWRSLLALFSVFAAVNAFVVKIPLGGGHRSATPQSLSAISPSRPSGGARRSPWTCVAPGGGKSAGAQVSVEKATTTIVTPKPKLQQEQKTKTTTKTKRATQTEDAPMFSVVLLGDEEYNRDHVLLSIQDIVPDTDNTKAVEIFEEAQRGGKGMCGVYPEEQAELYVEQFTRCEPMIFADMQREGKKPSVKDGA